MKAREPGQDATARAARDGKSVVKMLGISRSGEWNKDIPRG